MTAAKNGSQRAPYAGPNATESYRAALRAELARERQGLLLIGDRLARLEAVLDEMRRLAAEREAAE
jgi:sulfur relay (sulfurtransferase) DsrF/TusC family protein